MSVHLTADETGLHIDGALEGRNCSSIAARSRQRKTKNINALLKFDKNTYGLDVMTETDNVLETTRSLTVGVGLTMSIPPLNFVEGIPYDTVISMLKHLPNLTELRIEYDEVFERAATEMQEHKPEDFPRLRLEEYALCCAFPGCELPMTLYKRTLRRLTVSPGAMHPMTAAEMERFLAGFREVLPNLHSLTLACHRLPNVGEQSPLLAFSTRAAVELLEEMQLHLRLLELRITDDEAGLHEDGLLQRLLNACPGLRHLSVTPRLGALDASGGETYYPGYLWRRRDVTWLIDYVRRRQTEPGGRLRSVEIVARRSGRTTDEPAASDRAFYLWGDAFREWAKNNRIHCIFRLQCA